MTTKQPKKPSEHEVLAAALYTYKTGHRTKFHDLDHTQRADFSLHEKNQQIGLLEVTSIRNKPMLELERVMNKHNQRSFQVPGSHLFWSITLIAEQAPRIKDLDKQLIPRLQEIEARVPEGISLMPFSRSSGWEGTDPIIFDLYDLGVGWLHANPAHNAGLAIVNRGERGTPAMDMTTALTPCLAADNNHKLHPATSSGQKGVLFVWIDRLHSVAGSMRSQLFDEFWTALKPTSGPVLPEGISEIWAVHDVGLPTGLIWIWDGTTWAFDTWTEEDLQPAA